MIHQLSRIVLGAVDEARLAAAQHGQPEHDHPRDCRRHAAVVAHVPLRVDDGNVEPAVVGAEAGRPEDRPDLAAAEIDAARATIRARASARSVPARRGLPSSPGSSRAHSSKVSSRRFSFRSASANMFRSPPEKSAQPSRTAETRPTSSTPDRGQRIQIERRVRRADELRRGQAPGAGQVVDRVVPLVPHARPVHPPQHVASAVPAREADVLTDRERHRPPRAVDLVGELNARSPRRRRRARPRRAAGTDRGSRTG